MESNVYVEQVLSVNIQADDQTTMAGCLLSIVGPHLMYMYRMFVHDPHRGQGFGKQVVTAAIDIANENKCQLIIEPKPFSIGVGMDLNRLVAWYEAMGFKKGGAIGGRQMWEYRPDGVPVVFNDVPVFFNKGGES